MTNEDILAIAREVLSIRGHYDETGSTPKELITFARRIAGLERERIADEFSDRMQSDFENGVKFLSERVAEQFHKEYPNIAGFADWLKGQSDEN